MKKLILFFRNWYGQKLLLLVFFAVVTMLSFNSKGFAQQYKIKFNIPSQLVSSALDLFVSQTNISLIHSVKDSVSVKTQSVFGEYTPTKALKHMLTDTGYTFKHTSDSTISIKKLNHSQSNNDRSLSSLVADNEKNDAGGQQAKANPPSGSTNLPAEDYLLEATFVTSTRLGETELLKTPQSVTVFNPEALKAKGIENIRDLRYHTPGVEISPSDRSSTIYIRGIGSSAYGTNVAVHMDGVFLGEDSGAFMSDYLDIERVEVLRGPQGTLYGRNATAGAINVISLRPTEDLEWTASAEYGSYNRLRIEGVVSGPIVKDKVLGRLAILKSTHDGYMDNINPDHDDIFDENTTLLRGKLDINFSEKLRARLNLDYSSFDYAPNYHKKGPETAGQYHFGADVIEDHWTVASNVDQNIDLKYYGGGVEFIFDLPHNMILTSLTGYRESEIYYHVDMDHSEVTVGDYFQWYGSKQFSQEIQLSAKWNRLEGAIGLFYYNLELPENLYLARPEYVFPGFQVNGRYSMDTSAYAAFGNARYRITDKLYANAGIRYSYEKTEANGNQEIPAFSALTEFNGQESWSSLDPKVGIEYQLNNNLMLYGHVSTGFKSGNFNRDGGNIGEFFDQEEVVSYETGLKAYGFNRSLIFNLTGFYNSYKDLQVWMHQVTDLGPSFTVANAGKSTTKGFELEIVTRPVKGLTFNTTASYLDATYDEFLVVDTHKNIVNAAGNQMSFAPKWKASIGAQYVFDLGQHGFLTLSGDYMWRDKTFYNPFEDIMAGQESYGNVNALVRYETKDNRISLTLYGRNIGDEEVFDNVIHSSLAPVDYSGIVNAPRTFGLRLTYAWSQ